VNEKPKGKADGKKTRTDEEFLEALERMEALEETVAMTDEEIAEEIRRRGGDPEAIGKAGVELVERVLRGEGARKPSGG
jgi:hypothetical protein